MPAPVGASSELAGHVRDGELELEIRRELAPALERVVEPGEPTVASRSSSIENRSACAASLRAGNGFMPSVGGDVGGSCSALEQGLRLRKSCDVAR